jgi:hypothetical protein
MLVGETPIRNVWRRSAGASGAALATMDRAAGDDWRLC